jgi:hypothetical protein
MGVMFPSSGTDQIRVAPLQTILADNDLQMMLLLYGVDTARWAVASCLNCVAER